MTIERVNHNIKLQLFMLPFAGGNSFSFMKTMRFLRPEIECIPVEYPGRERRTNEVVIDSYAGFISYIIRYIQDRLNDNVPYAILGYSMGCALAFDITSNSLLSKKPIYCFFCAESPVNSLDSVKRIANLSFDEFKSTIAQLGGVDDRITADAENNQYMKLIQNDFRILEQYQYNNAILPINSSIIYSPSDNSCINMNEWGNVLSGEIQYYTLDGGHFFIKRKYRELAAIINDNLSVFLS